MSKAYNIVAVLVLAATMAAAAQAKEPTAIQRLVAQEQAKRLDVEQTAPTAVQSVIAQEQGRRLDARLFGQVGTAPIQVVGPPDRFDFRDAGVGGMVGLAVALARCGGGRTSPGQPEASDGGCVRRELISPPGAGVRSCSQARRPDPDSREHIAIW